MNQEKDLDIQVSSTSLGYKEDGGVINAAIALGEGIISKDAYTQTVIKNAHEFKEETEKIFPNAEFGVSVLASSINPEKMKGLITSVDYPYSVKWGLSFIKEKQEKIKNEGQEGFGGMVSLAQELGYAMLQSSSDKGQMKDTIEVSNSVALNPIMIRTCIETALKDEEIEKIKKITTTLDKDVIWVIEPNKKIGDGTYSSFLETYDRILKGNPNINFGIDLDLGGLPKEHNLLSVLDHMNTNDMYPLLLSLSGKEYVEGDVITHLPLGKSIDENKQLGEYLYKMQLRGEKIPGLVIESSPAIRNSLRDYSQFLDSFAKGFNH